MAANVPQRYRKAEVKWNTQDDTEGWRFLSKTSNIFKDNKELLYTIILEHQQSLSVQALSAKADTSQSHSKDVWENIQRH